MSLIIRTLAQAAAGAILAALAARGLSLPDETAAALAVVLAAVMAGLQREAELRWPALASLLHRPLSQGDVVDLIDARDSLVVQLAAARGEEAHDWEAFKRELAAEEAAEQGQASDLP